MLFYSKEIPTNVNAMYSLNIDCFYYIGITNDPRRRLQQHGTALKKGTHDNKKLQWLYDKYPKKLWVTVHPLDPKLTREELFDLEAFTLFDKRFEPYLLNAVMPKPVVIKGVLYRSGSVARKKLKLRRRTLLSRLRSKRFPDYKYLE